MLGSGVPSDRPVSGGLARSRRTKNTNTSRVTTATAMPAIDCQGRPGLEPAGSAAAAAVSVLGAWLVAVDSVPADCIVVVAAPCVVALPGSWTRSAKVWNEGAACRPKSISEM